ncbi:MAG: hypothetical protein QM484_14185 [Woeseiaceae bacterium]
MDKQDNTIKRVMRKCYPFFVALNLLFFSHVTFATTQTENALDEVRKIATTGAVSLALLAIDGQQPSLDKNNFKLWLSWERERLTILNLGQRWQAITDRVTTYKLQLPMDFYLWAKQQQVDALLKLKKGQQARQVIQFLLWSKEMQASRPQLEKNLAAWQKRIIKSYLVDSENSDALFAAQRYYQTYGHEKVEERLLQARILLMNQRADEVVDLLAKDTQHPEGGMLYLLAQLRSKVRPAQKVLQSSLRQMRGKWADNKLKYMLWAVVAESSNQSHDRGTTTNALEHVLAGNKNIQLPYGLFNFSSESLWTAYLDYAVFIGNRSQFLIGNDQQWLNAAVKAQIKEPVKARSLFAMVLLNGQKEETKSRATKGFLNLMHKRKRGAELVKKLFLDSDRFKTIKSIPALVRYDLVKIALSRSDIDLASNLMVTIHEAPKGVDVFQWQLRRARIFVLSGKHEQGYQALEAIISKQKLWEQKELESFLQVVFDLQTAKANKHAFLLFQSILPKVLEIKIQREIYYWMADSKKSMGEYAAAARLYLQSALHQGNNGLDPWGQTARYQVAEMLAKADLLEDAHVIYEHLLRVTKDPARRAVLKHELQKLWLLRKNNEESINSDVETTE